jgi:hypothetical protein
MVMRRAKFHGPDKKSLARSPGGIFGICRSRPVNYLQGEAGVL